MISHRLLLASALLLGACGSRSPLSPPQQADAEEGGGGAAGEPPPPPPDGGAAPTSFACDGELALQPVASIDVAGGLPSNPALVPADDHDDVVSVFHAWSFADGTADGLHVTTIEPWGAWPPAFGAHFSISGADVTPDYRVGDAGHGFVHLLVQHVDPEGDYLGFTAFTNAASPSELLDVSVSLTGPDELTPPLEAPLGFARGYDDAPVSCQLGYLGTLGMWDAPLGQGLHAVRTGVWTSECNTIAGMAMMPDPNLACANATMQAAVVRSEKSWLVASASGDSGLGDCDAASAGPPTDLVIDRLAWGDPTTIDWTVERTATEKGSSAITSVRIAATADRTYVLVQREDGAPELLRVEPDGTLGEPIATSAPESGGVSMFDFAAVEDGFVAAYVDSVAPARVRVELYDRDGARRSGTTVDAGGSVSSLAIMPSRSGAGALIGWQAQTPSGAEIELTRFDCAGGSR